MAQKNLPDELSPTGTLPVVLSSGRLIYLPCCRPTFVAWAGPAPKFTFGRKPVLTYNRSPVFAEILILRLLESKGWNGVWVSSYGGIKFLREMPEDPSLALGRVTLPDNQAYLLQKISQRLGGRGGCLDVFAWKNNHVIFCEAKRLKRDALRLSQRKWIEAAICEGVPSSSILIVEWTITSAGSAVEK
jgi:hypothetical protein